MFATWEQALNIVVLVGSIAIAVLSIKPWKITIMEYRRQSLSHDI